MLIGVNNFTYCTVQGDADHSAFAISSNHTEFDRNPQILIKLQSLVFGHKEVEKLIYLSSKRPKMALLEHFLMLK